MTARRRLHHLILIAVIVSAVPARAAPVTLPDRTERVIGLARLWAKAKFFHPYLAYKDLDWDAAFLAALPTVEAATTPATFRAAVAGMLAVLGDPVTRLIDPPPPRATAPLAAWLSTPAPYVVKVKIAGFVGGTRDYVALDGKARQVAAQAAASKVMIVDLRTAPGDAGAAADALDLLLRALPAIDDWPLQRFVEHRGYRTQDGRTSGDYFSTFLTLGAQPAKPAPAVGVAHVVFIVDRDSGLPGPALALQAAGRGVIVSQGPLLEDSSVETVNVAIPGGLTAQLRVGEALWGPPAANLTVATARDGDTQALGLAKVLITANPTAKPRPLLPLPPLRARDDLDYADAPYPSREHRVLAGIRLWAVLDTFSPYRALAGDWDGALRDALPRLAQAADRDAYLHALRLLAAQFGDGHIRVSSAEVDAVALGSPPFEVRLVEGKLVVVRLLDAPRAEHQGVALGDAIETVDGKPIAAALAEIRAELSGSTDEARDQRTAEQVLHGAATTTTKLGVRGADGTLRELRFVRASRDLDEWSARERLPRWKLLPGKIGYVDLRLLRVPEIGPMFDALAGTRAIVFDMRGYPNGTARALAARVNTRKAKVGAQFLEPLVSAIDSQRRIQFLQTVAERPAGTALYTGKIVVLIDDRAISQAEHTCLFLAEAAGATFVGSPTHGANGDVTRMRLPGGLQVSFTGQEVRHVDGRPLQRVGIQPDVVVRPTIAGVRAGRDEVLDRALAWLAP